MTSRQVIHFEFQQSLSWDSDRPSWSESLQATVHLTDAALSSGWLRQYFSGRRGGANDFLVLVSIVMHARPLRGIDLSYLVGLGMATLQDEGRLFARVTDLGLANELGMHRRTIAASAERLKQSGFIVIAEVPEEIEYRDSKGRFSGSKVYLLSGEMQKHFLSKDLQPLQSNRVDLTDTDNASTVSDKPTHRVGSSDINLRGGEGGGDSFSADAEEKIWALFANLKGEAGYQPKPREKHLLQQLFTEGYAFEQILDGIQSAFQEKTPGDTVRHYGFCVPVIRAKPPKTSSDLAQDPVSAKSGSVPAVDLGSTNASSDLAQDTVSAKPGSIPVADPVSTAINNLPEAPHIPEQVTRIFTQANHGQPPTSTDLWRLDWLYEECVPAAQQNCQEAWDWIVTALKDSAGQAHNLLAYTTALLRHRITQGTPRGVSSASPPTTTNEGQKGARNAPKNSAVGTNPAPTALTRREPSPPRSSYVIPAEYSQASLLRALEQIPDD